MSFDLQALQAPITRILSAPGVDLTTISAKRVRKTLIEDPQYATPGLTAEVMKERRIEVDQIISRVFETVSRAAANDGLKRRREEDEGEEWDAADEQVDASEDSGEAQVHTKATTPKKRKGKKTVEESDAELARKLSTQINSRSRRAPPNAAASSPKKAKRKPKKSAKTVDSGDEDDDDGGEVKKKKRGGAKGGFAKEYTLSDPLSTLVGVEKLSRPQVVKKLWEYIHGHELQNPSNKKEIICDDAFRAVFAVDKIDMFRMNKVLGQHLHEE
ncbi:SWIB-domain-containing protein [Paxillus ammoniavirescens]|nr:SWIB-domain-containing protein [Paxillus ammoniavirescens]